MKEEPRQVDEDELEAKRLEYKFSEEEKTRIQRFIDYYNENYEDIRYYFFFSFLAISVLSFLFYHLVIKEKKDIVIRNNYNYQPLPVRRKKVQQKNIDFFEMVKTPPRRSRISDKLR